VSSWRSNRGEQVASEPVAEQHLEHHDEHEAVENVDTADDQEGRALVIDDLQDRFTGERFAGCRVGDRHGIRSLCRPISR
jgi:hypothetical protein